MRQKILNKKIKVENEIKTEFQTVFIKQELNDQLQNKLEENDNIKQEEPDDKEEIENKVDDLEQLSQNLKILNH